MFKSVIFSAISLSWCVASGLTGRPALGEHELEQGLSLSSPLILAHHLRPERFMERIKQSQERERGAKIDANSVASEMLEDGPLAHRALGSGDKLSRSRFRSRH